MGIGMLKMEKEMWSWGWRWNGDMVMEIWRWGFRNWGGDGDADINTCYYRRDYHDKPYYHLYLSAYSYTKKSSKFVNFVIFKYFVIIGLDFTLCYQRQISLLFESVLQPFCMASYSIQCWRLNISLKKKKKKKKKKLLMKTKQSTWTRKAMFC